MILVALKEMIQNLYERSNVRVAATLGKFQQRYKTRHRVIRKRDHIFDAKVGVMGLAVWDGSMPFRGESMGRRTIPRFLVRLSPIPGTSF